MYLVYKCMQAINLGVFLVGFPPIGNLSCEPVPGFPELPKVSTVGPLVARLRKLQITAGDHVGSIRAVRSATPAVKLHQYTKFSRFQAPPKESEMSAAAVATAASFPAAVREAAEVALRGASEDARRAGAVPAAVRRLAPSTCRLRGHALNRFAAWMDANPQLPSLAAAVDAWAESLFDAGKSVATVASAVSAVRWWASAAGLEGAKRLGAEAVADARRDGDRRRRGRGQAGAVDWDAADKAARRAARAGTPKGLRDAALIAVTSDLCARVSEVAALRVRDVTRETDGAATAEVWQAKTGKARTGYLRASTVRRLDAWRSVAQIDAGDAALFPAVDRWGNVRNAKRPMQPRAIADVIRHRAAAIGLRASGHSLRVGAAVSMAARGASLVAMQQVGGWTAPDMPAHYGRQASARKGPVASLRAEDRWA